MRPAMLLVWIMGAALLPVALAGQKNAAASVGKDLIRVDSPVTALEHVRVIDGTGAAAKPDQTIVISAGKIVAIGDSDSVKVPENARRIDFAGHTALPGLVGMQITSST
jgi:imidazolonepropionase-like amidohydrolase